MRTSLWILYFPREKDRLFHYFVPIQELEFCQKNKIKKRIMCAVTGWKTG